ncbi:MAG: DUF4836 family protein [Chitinophagaceae bacterium]
MKPIPYLPALLALAFLASCSKQSKVPVPADAAMVLHVDGRALQSKLSWEEFKQGELYKIAAGEAEGELTKKILDHPDSSGVDLASDLFLFIRNRGTGTYIGFTCPVKDEKLFNSYITRAANGETITKHGDLSVISSGNSVLTWNDKRIVAISADPSPGPGHGFGKMNRQKPITPDSLVKFAAEVYSLSGSNSIGSNKHFVAMMKDTGDAHIWINPGSLAGSMRNPLLSLAKTDVLTNGNYAAATLHFDQGKITVDVKSYYNKKLETLYEKYKPENLDADMLKNIPAGDVTAVMAAKYHPQALRDLLVLVGLDGFANGYLGKAGLSLDDFVKANKGDLLFAVSDFGMAGKEIYPPLSNLGQRLPHNISRPDAKILFATSVADKASFEKLVTLLQTKIAEGGEKLQAIAGRVPYVLNDKWFIAGTDSVMVHTYGATSTNHPFISKIIGHPMGGYIDFRHAIAGTRPMADSAFSPLVNESLHFWEDVVFYGGERKDDAMESHFEINLKDKSTNSLKQLNTYLGRMARTMMNERKRRGEETMRQWQESIPDNVIIEGPKLRRK